MNALVLIQSVSITLGLVTPLIVCLILRSGISNSSLPEIKKGKFISISAVLISAWTILIWVLTLQGFFSYDEQEIIPGFLLALIFPLIFALFILQPAGRILIDAIPLRTLAAGQWWRLLGAIFFVVALSEIGPRAYIGSGIGDVLTGLLAIITFWLTSKKASGSRISAWLLTLVGMFDLVMVLYIMISHYPLWSDAVPSTASAGVFPMMLIVGLAAPVALVLHIFLIRRLLSSPAIN